VISVFAPPVTGIAVNGKPMIGFTYEENGYDEDSKDSYDYPLDPITHYFLFYSQNPMDLRKININDYSGSEVASITFEKLFIGYSPARMFLSSINSTLEGKYTFYYKKGSLGPPHNNTTAMDYWGFWNGQGYTGLLTDYLNINNFNNGLYNQFMPNFTKKDPSFMYSAFGGLERIIYPTGGKSEITYEQNVVNQRINKQNTGPYYEPCPSGDTVVGGVRVKRIDNYRDDMSDYVEYLGASTNDVNISYFDIFQEDCLKPDPFLPHVTGIASEGGIFTCEARFSVSLDSLLYESIEQDMNTVGIPGYWTPGEGVKIELDVVPLSGVNYKSRLKISFICEPNFSTEPREQNTMFYLASDTKTVTLVQPGDPTASLGQFDVTGEWLNYDDFNISTSGSQPGVQYTLSKNQGSDDIVVKSLAGTGYSLDFGAFTGMENHGIYHVSASYGSKSARIGNYLYMTRPDDIGGGNYTAVRTLLDTAGISKNTNVTYYNGLGYPIQIISGNASGDGRAVATPITYDNLRRPDAKGYLPYPTETYMFEETEYSLEEQNEYYAALYGKEAFPSYTSRTFETYGNGRVLSVRRPGDTYSRLDKETVFDYRLNTLEDGILRLKYVFGADISDSVKCTGNYDVNTLACTRTVNEDSDTSFVFVDTFGRKVMSRRINGGDRYDTYYVYDLKDSLVCVVQPEGVKIMPQTFPLSGEFADKWCFTYKYDAFGNIAESHVPGGGHNAVFHDRRNRPVFYSDDMLRAAGKYRFAIYDRMNRIIREGYCTIAHTEDEIRALIEDGSDPYQIMSDVLSVVRDVSYYSAGGQYSSAGFRPDRHTDNASALDLLHCATLMRSETLYPEPDLSDAVMTQSRSSVHREYFYDSFGRTIQVAETFEDGSKSTNSYKYDYTGNVLVSSEIHELADGRTDSLVTECTYDNFGRRTGCNRVLNGKTYPAIYYTYDGLGRPETVSAGNRIRETYAYNLQGALSRLENDAYGQSALMQILKYSDPVLTTSIPRYSGQISEIAYSDAEQDSQYMSYYYDHAGRLVDSERNNDMQEPSGEYEERNIGYDSNGNLLTVTRHLAAGDSTAISFGYAGNRMDSISAGDSLWNCSWYPDGSLASEGRRRLKFSYNWLKLPVRISMADSAVLKYSYLSDGTKLSVRDSLSGRCLKFRGSFICIVSPGGTETVESVAYDEGRLYAVDSADFIDTWFVRDYLGSVRAVIDITNPSASQLSQILLSHSDYLPFGMAVSPDGTGSTAPSAVPQSALSRFLYNGKPEQVSGIASTGLLDYGARMYDPFAVRWTTVDPMAEKYAAVSPYSFCGGDPVNFVDPFGRRRRVVYNTLNNTIKIKATFYHDIRITKEVNTALSVFNNMSGLTYIDDIGNTFSVKFELQGRRTSTPAKLANSNINGNYIDIKKTLGVDKNGNKKLGGTKGNHISILYDSIDNILVLSHEIGHALGAALPNSSNIDNHAKTGLMVSSIDNPSISYVLDSKSIKEIIENTDGTIVNLTSYIDVILELLNLCDE